MKKVQKAEGIAEFDETIAIQRYKAEGRKVVELMDDSKSFIPTLHQQGAAGGAASP